MEQIWISGDNMGTYEEKATRFKRVAEKRTNKIIDQIRLLGNCANKSNYEYTDKEVDRIFSAIESELEITKSQYKSRKDSRKFKL